MKPLARLLPTALLFAACTSFGASPSAARAQSAQYARPTGEVSGHPAPLRVGEQVRVTWWDMGYPSAWTASRMTTAEVIDVSEEALMLCKGRRVFGVPLGSVRTVKRRIGTKPASAPAMVAGSAGGFAVGFAVGFLTGGILGGSASVDRGEAGLTTGVLIGAPVGAIIAWATSRSRGIYEEIPLSDVLTGLVVDPRGGVSVSIPTGR